MLQFQQHHNATFTWSSTPVSVLTRVDFSTFLRCRVFSTTRLPSPVAYQRTNLVYKPRPPFPSSYNHPLSTVVDLLQSTRQQQQVQHAQIRKAAEKEEVQGHLSNDEISHASRGSVSQAIYSYQVTDTNMMQPVTGVMSAMAVSPNATGQPHLSFSCHQRSGT
jgi:hypothetical protein